MSLCLAYHSGSNVYISCLALDIQVHQFRAQVLSTTAVQISWDQAPSWRDIGGYHIFYKLVSYLLSVDYVILF